MFKFGKNPPRSLESFGVSGLLEEGCKVFYDSLFSVRHIGRVSDLFAARLREVGADELRLRSLILFNFFEAWTAQTQATPTKDGILSQPVVIECGIDSEKIAFGVAFSMPEGKDFRQFAGFEDLLNQLHAVSDQVVLRVHAETLRAEIVAMVAIPGKIELGDLPPVEIVEIQGQPVEAPAASYVELGDLDYPKLLKEDEPGTTTDAKIEADGDAAVVVAGSTHQEELEETQNSSRAEPQDEEQTSTSSSTQGEETKVTVGSHKGVDDELIKVKGSKGPEAEDAMIKISGNAPIKKDDQVVRIAAGPKDDAEENETIRISSVAPKGAKPGRSMSVKSHSSGDEGAPDEAGPDEEIVRFAASQKSGSDKLKVKRISSSEASQGEPDPDAGDDGSVDADVTGGTSVGAAPIPKVEDKDIPENVQAEKLIQEIEAGGIERTIRKSKLELADAVSAGDPAKAKRWMDGMMNEIMLEKARIAEMAKSLTLATRQKELEFRQMEAAMREQLRQKDEQVKQKTAALLHTKEKLAQMNVAYERLKTDNSAHGAVAASSSNQKVDVLQKTIDSQREEACKLKSKIEELKNQVAAASLAKKTGGASGSGDAKELQEKNIILQKKIEEMKKQQKELSDRLAEAKKTSAAAPKSADLQVKVDAAVKASQMHQREAEKLQAKLQELQKEQIAAKYEVGKLQAEIRALKGGKTPSAAGTHGSAPGNKGGKAA